ncbi:helix-turn-helix domain-containing protein [Leptolyngbya sp. NIES-2104]|uniref:helix-turn-helix domain-containing protein n=1 Tax=Leptolyngbya sp. NIES-2104 TaxID=1552121 RepID=UPI0006EC8C41|nr:helix-turn-helix transcriptional regulator [Leptolyngbya sp. NIES-2104]GAP99606.1 hypothetical protein NIES2104_61720 [Leptolyngbya sp. NIES-2104]
MLVSKLPKIMEHYGLNNPDVLHSMIKQDLSESSLNRDQLIKLYYGHTKRLSRETLLDCCRLFGIKRVSQLIDLDTAPEAPDEFLEMQPDSVFLMGHLPEILKQQGRSQYRLEMDTRMHANTISSWVNDFDSMNRFELSSIEKICRSLNLPTIDRLLTLKVVPTRGRRKAKTIWSRFHPEEKRPNSLMQTNALKTA